MSESKTYIFGENQNGGSNGMLGLLAPLLQKQGVDPNVLLAMKGNNGLLLAWWIGTGLLQNKRVNLSTHPFSCMLGMSLF